MKAGGVEEVPVPLGLLLNTLSWLADASWKFSQACHNGWCLAMVRWGTREQQLEYQRRLNEVYALLDSKE